MGDTDMLDNEAPSGLGAGVVEAGIQQKEASGTESDQNPSGNAQSHYPEDKTPASTSDVSLPDVVHDERAGILRADNETDTNMDSHDGTGIAGKVDEKTDAKVVDETRTNAEAGDETIVDAKLGDEARNDNLGDEARADEICGDAKPGLEIKVDAKVVEETGTDAIVGGKTSADVKPGIEASAVAKSGDETGAVTKVDDESGVESDAKKVHDELDTNDKVSCATVADGKSDNKTGGDAQAGVVGIDSSVGKSNGGSVHVENQPGLSPPPVHSDYLTPNARAENGTKWKTWLLSDDEVGKVDEAGTPEEQAQFIKEVENFHKEHFLDFKAPKFYGQPLNCLKLWRAVIKLGGYDVVTASKLWRQVGESFHPPKTCTTVSWTFRIFYEKALLEYEKYLRQNGELQLPGSALPQFSSVEKEANNHSGSGSGRARRDAAARAMQGWHAQRLLGSGDVTEPIVKDKSINSASRREKNLKSIGLQKQKMPTNSELLERPLLTDGDKQVAAEVVDVGPPADWVKINVRENKDCFEIYALVPGLLREEVRVQSDPAGRLVITGQPEQLDNPWGITPFKKVVNLPARIDPLQTSAVVSLHGRLYVRVPFEQ